MKRTLAMLLTVAMVGSLMFMGFAGTAAAHNDDDQSNDATVKQGQYVEQTAETSSDGSFAVAAGDNATANTGNIVNQESTNTQTATVDQANYNIEDSWFIGL